MPHRVENIHDYHAGDALDITVTVLNEDDTRKDIANGSAEWLLKETAEDDDTSALLTKDTDGGGVTLTDAANGELQISLATEDTSGMSGAKHHRLRVTDSDGDRVTVFHGDFTIST